MIGKRELIVDKLLKLENITKRFPGVVALDHVDLAVDKGEVLALAGENGAGKSTLIKIISGAYQQDEGDIFLEGQKTVKLTPKKAIDSGIAVIYQELSYMPFMSIAENIFLGSQPKKHGAIDYRSLYQKSMEIQKEVGLGHLAPDVKVQKLSTAERQLLEIARAYARNMRILILDEPTSALNDKETQILFKQINKLKSEGKAIIYISHKLDEIYEICNKIQIMRDGQVVHYGDLKDMTKQQIISLMVGREIKDMYPISKREFGADLLTARGLCNDRLKDVSLCVKQGEIVGLYGLMGAGCPEVLESIFGIRKLTAGEIEIDGKSAPIKNPGAAIERGLAYTPGERKSEGLMLSQSVLSNLSMVTLKKYKRGPVLNLKREREAVKRWIDILRIKTPSIRTLVENLSGGNQQKVILARWLDNEPKVFLMNEPTKGIDVGAKVEIYKQIEDICKKKCAVILVTAELTEIMSVCDRIYVFHEGHVTGEFEKSQMTQEEIVKKAIGD